MLAKTQSVNTRVVAEDPRWQAPEVRSARFRANSQPAISGSDVASHQSAPPCGYAKLYVSKQSMILGDDAFSQRMAAPPPPLTQVLPFVIVSPSTTESGPSRLLKMKTQL